MFVVSVNLILIIKIIDIAIEMSYLAICVTFLLRCFYKGIWGHILFSIFHSY
jgi:hypothetical protein